MQIIKGGAQNSSRSKNMVAIRPKKKKIQKLENKI